MKSCAAWRGDGSRETMTASGLYDDGIVTRADKGFITFGDGFGFGWPDEYPMPKVGDQLRVYGGFGREICGVDVNGETRYWITVEEMDARHAEWLAKRKADQEQAFIDGEAELDAQFDALPPELQKRIAQMREAGGRKWRVENEGYEMFCCTQAVVIASLGSEEAIRRWDSINSKTPPDGYEPYDYKRQAEELPGYSDGHSGNTHAVAVGLAIMLLNGQRERLVALPAALSPLAGDPRYPD